MEVSKKKRNIFVIEDAAQGMLSTYKGRPLGSIGHMAAYSFHETKKTIPVGEGGLLIINDAHSLSIVQRLLGRKEPTEVNFSSTDR